MNKNSKQDSPLFDYFAPLILALSVFALFFALVNDCSPNSSKVESKAIIDKINRPLRFDWYLIKSKFNKGDIDAVVAKINTKAPDIQLYGRGTGKNLPLVDCLDAMCLTQADDKYIPPEYIHHSVTGISQCNKAFDIDFRIRVVGPSGLQLYRDLQKKASLEEVRLIGTVGEYAKAPNDFSKNQYVGLPLMLISDATLRHVLYPEDYQRLQLEEIKLQDNSDLLELSIQNSLNKKQVGLDGFAKTLLQELATKSGNIQILDSIEIGVGQELGAKKSVHYFEPGLRGEDSVQRFIESKYAKDIFLCE